MPNNFQLTKKGETVPSMLAKIDEDICMYLGKPVDPVEWYCDWCLISLAGLLLWVKNWGQNS